jgi:hypothetical protein
VPVVLVETSMSVVAYSSTMVIRHYYGSAMVVRHYYGSAMVYICGSAVVVAAESW